MRLISHRGNISGRIEEAENRPDYIEDALRLGYDVEIDLRVKDGKLYLGHNEPQYPLDIDWLEKHYTRLWLHCKDITFLEKLSELNSCRGYLNYFWHETDTVTITSKGYLWAYPGKQPIKNSIAVMPELNNDDISQCYGICSDYISKYR